MTEELLQKIQEIQSYLYGGYKDAVKTNTEWLSQLSLKFIALFKMLQSHLTTFPSNSLANQSFLLCARQITLCIKYLEKTTRVEASIEQAVLITARQCFFDRIIWCIGRLKSTISSKSTHHQLIGDECSFTDLLDIILESLSYFLTADEHNVSNKAEHRANLMMESSRIEESVKELLSMAMTFSNISLDNDKTPLTVLSQNLFKTSREFRSQFSLSDSNRIASCGSSLKALDLENALYKLENYVNDALLRLVYHTFNDINADPFEKLQAVGDEKLQKEEIERIDVLIERFLLIGQFAISFCKEDVKTLSVIRSCLASIETLDTYLVPAIASRTIDPSIDILKLHFYEESRELQTQIHFIIDSRAFCMSLVQQLVDVEESNKKKNGFDRKGLLLMIDFSKILLTHFSVNAANLKLAQDKVVKFYFNDYKLMVAECEAILNFPDPIENFERRVIKRFNILKNTIRKIVSAIKVSTNDFDDKEKEAECVVEVHVSRYSDYFDTIRPSALGSILYESKRSIKFPKNATLKPAIKTPNKRNESLRMAMFRKTQDMPIEKEEEEELTDLHITEILDQLSIHVAKKN